MKAKSARKEGTHSVSPRQFSQPEHSESLRHRCQWDRTRLQWEIHREVLPRPGANVTDVARAREEVAELVEGDGHHPVGGVERLLQKKGVG